MFSEPSESGEMAYLPVFSGTAVPDFESALTDMTAENLDRLYRKWGERPLTDALAECFFEAMLLYRVAGSSGEEKRFFFGKAADILRRLPEVEAAGGAHPAARDFWRCAAEKAREICSDPAAVEAWVNSADPASGAKVFAVKHGRLVPLADVKIRKTSEFFSFYGVRNALAEAMADFRQGRGNVPLLLSSLPGHGKTQMTLAYAADNGLSVVIPPPGCLEKGLEELFALLGRLAPRCFVLFFDDIEVAETDWTEFRNLVGGIYSPPENVLLCVSSNYDFPPGILSRGRSVRFPLFDENRCLEMTEDFLKNSGMKKPSSNLVNLIAADYTELFGQRHFSELSPRTLARYFDEFRRDMPKRKRLLELSGGELITRPDAGLFYEFNINIMRDMYGAEYIEELRRRKLREIESGKE